MITEDYVSFEIAKLLKKKGFDERCKYVWELDKANDPQDNDGISKICAERFMEGESFVDNSDIKKVFEYEDWFEDYHKVYLCPTLQMTMKWLRKVHHIDISIIPLRSHKEYLPRIESDAISHDAIPCKEYEEACEIAIKYCLEHLI